MPDIWQNIQQMQQDEPLQNNMQKQGRPVKTNSRYRAMHKSQQGSEANWQSINADEVKNVDVLTTKSLSFDSAKGAK